MAERLLPDGFLPEQAVIQGHAEGFRKGPRRLGMFYPPREPDRRVRAMTRRATPLH